MFKRIFFSNILLFFYWISVCPCTFGFPTSGQDLPLDIWGEVGRHLDHFNFARLKMASKTLDRQLAPDLIYLYLQAHPGVRNWSAGSLYRFCLQHVNNLVPSVYPSLLACFEVVDQLSLRPGPDVRLEIMYRLMLRQIETPVTLEQTFNDLLTHTPWQPKHQAALLQWAAMGRHTFFSQSWKFFCVDSIGRRHLEGSCLQSIFAYRRGPESETVNLPFVLDITSTDAYDQRHREYLAQEARFCLTMYKRLEGRLDRHKQRALLLELEASIVHAIGNGSNVNSVCVRDGFYSVTFPLFPENEGLTVNLLQQMFDLGFDPNWLAPQFNMLPSSSRIFRHKLLVQVILNAGGKFSFDIPSSEMTAVDLHYYRSIPVGVLQLLKESGAEGKVMIGIFAPANVEKAKLLVQYKIAHANAVDFEGRNNLFFPISVPILRFLIREGINGNQVDVYHENALHTAAFQFLSLNRMHLLLSEARVSPDHQDFLGNTVLMLLAMYASALRHVMLFEYLLDFGARWDLRNRDGKTVRDLLIRRGNELPSDQHGEGRTLHSVKMAKNMLKVLSRFDGGLGSPR